MDLIHSCYLLILERVFTLICKKIEIGDRESKEFGYREIVWRDDYKYDFAIFVPYAIEFKWKSWNNKKIMIKQICDLLVVHRHIFHFRWYRNAGGLYEKSCAQKISEEYFRWEVHPRV